MNKYNCNVAVLVATYNGEKYIGEQLESLCNQTYLDFKVYIHDDGSKDDTLSAVSYYCKKYPDKFQLVGGPIQYSSKKNFLWMLSMITADYYFLCDQDDVWLPDKLEKELEAINILQDSDSTKANLVFSDMYVVDSRLNVLSDSFISYIGRDISNLSFSQVIVDNPAAGCTMCFNRVLRDIAIKDYGIDFSKVPMHDAYLLEIAVLLGAVKALDEPLVYYRQTGNNVMGAKHESILKKICRNLVDLVLGRAKAAKRAFFQESRDFAGEIAKLPNVMQEKRQILLDYANIADKPKAERIAFYKENNFSRRDHNFWFYLWV